MTKISALFFSRAMSKGDLSNLLKAWTSAPYLISSSTTSRWWCSVAQCKAVIFSMSLAFTSAPFYYRKATFQQTLVTVAQVQDPITNYRGFPQRSHILKFRSCLRNIKGKNILKFSWVLTDIMLSMSGSSKDITGKLYQMGEEGERTDFCCIY
jgi:hypothetical protein